MLIEYKKYVSALAIIFGTEIWQQSFTTKILIFYDSKNFLSDPANNEDLIPIITGLFLYYDIYTKVEIFLLLPVLYHYACVEEEVGTCILTRYIENLPDPSEHVRVTR